MQPAEIEIPKPHLSRCAAGFTLIEVIVSLVVVGILASVAGMGIVSAVNGYAVVKENVGLAQKIQLTATRINRELLELTAISARDHTRPYIVYYSATGQRQAIAKVNDTIRLYDNPTEPISDTYLQNNGDILTDRVDSLALNYFQGGNNWDGADLRELSTIQFSFTLFRQDSTGSTVSLTTLVHLRNNDNYGGSAANLPVAPPTGEQYACFISTSMYRPVGLGLTRARRLIGWLLAVILPLSVVGSFIKAKDITPAKAKNPFTNKDDGSALIGIIITIMVFAALGAAIVPMISSSQLHRTATSRSTQAYYLAESGLRFAASQYLNAISENDKYAALNDLHGVTHRLQGNQGEFSLSVNPYYFSVEVDPANTTTLVTRIYGQLADSYSVPVGGGSLSIDDSIYAFSSASIVGQQVTFALSSSLTVPVDTPVFPVAQALAGHTVSNGSDLSLSPGSGDMFPDRNGAFELSGETYTYRENNRPTNTLMGIKRTDGSTFSSFPLTANENIRLKKFVKITSTGAVGSGDMMASHAIVYHVQVPEKKEPRRITFYEKFDDLNEWNSSVFGTHEIADLGGNNVLRVTGVTQSGVEAPSASLIPLNTGAVQFNPKRFDVQVKVGYLETPSPPTHGYDPLPIPKYYSAGLCFQLYGNADTYGLSFQRGGTSVSPPDNIENDLIPADDIHTLVLWQATNNVADKVWLAYKQISDVNLDSSAQEITELHWVDRLGKKYSDAITDLSSVPVLPCDFGMIKLKFSSTCDPLLADCTTLEISIDGGGTWILAQENEADLTAYAGQTITNIQFRINAGALGWHIFNLEFTADDYDVENATLLARFEETASITFDTGGPDAIEPGDRIIGNISGASASANGAPVLQSGSWAASDAAGTLILDEVNGPFQINERLSVAGKSELATLTGFRAQDNFIKAYLGTESGCGTPNTDPLDGEKHPNPIDPAELNWPPDEGDPWTADKDHFQLIQWDALNSAVGTVQRVDSLDQPNTLIRSSEAALMGLGSTLGLHTFGQGSLNIYFDDFAYQSFVDQPVAISQPIQY